MDQNVVDESELCMLLSTSAANVFTRSSHIKVTVALTCLVLLSLMFSCHLSSPVNVDHLFSYDFPKTCCHLHLLQNVSVLCTGHFSDFVIVMEL